MTKEEYLKKIQLEIDNRKRHGKRTLYRIKEKIPFSFIIYLVNHFNGNDEYMFEWKDACSNCGDTYTFHIYFLK